ncbi:DUF3857 domain-containing transglutaminase family protein [Flavilitoribacter nigricans]|uniref:DUF3857 domain-containing protein n=1 Tax=Flavilitoribacter nigricans (strain ATCC 23147 / DSM 23189 / NBRC 102662 / NCIMB 1420 / SS-2) TaxID=1122177 RepID=A0A2D0NDL4_FLAN2|nr:DUF3857 and transglutaminase domain-containing protein [Flavilitoribacter nigricans]PHN06575.1 hypothetical protein CRP01_09730 [Flavilitoribacter nigricans DSM 23189 = NBRC 102662]
MKSFSLIICCLWIFSGGTVLQGQVIDYRTFVRIEKGKRITEKSFQIQINHKDQEDLANIEIPYSADQELDLLEAYIVDRSGQTVRKLKKKEVTVRSNISQSSFHEDDYVQTFQLHWHEFPYQIRYSYRLTEQKFIYVARWHPVLYTTVPTLSASLSVEVPADYPLAIDYSPALDYTTEKQGDVVLHRWQAKVVEVPKSETLAPPFSEIIPLATVVPQRFDYAIEGSMGSWAEYGDWHERLNASLDELPAAEGRVVDKLLAGITDQRERIQKLYHHLQDHTRYINVAIDVGGLKPYPAAYVAKNKYGDCKALTIYMKALLKWAGIPSHYVVIHAGSNPVRVKAGLPSQQFNHVILGVPLEGDTIWLENTAGYLPYNYLGTFTQNRLALWVDGMNSRLVRTPTMELSEVLEHSTYRFQLQESGQGRVEVSQRLRGKTFESLLFGRRELTDQQLQDRIEAGIPWSTVKLSNWEIIQPHRDQTDLELKLELEARDQFRRIGRLVVLQPPEIDLPDLESPSVRKQSVRIPYPVNQQDEMFYELPFLAKYRVELPDPIAIETPFGLYSEHYQLKDTGMVLNRTFQLYRGDYPLETYPELYNFIQAIRNARKQAAVVLTAVSDD